MSTVWRRPFMKAKLHRRAFMKGSGALVLAFSVSPAFTQGATPSPKQVDSWLKIDGSGTVTPFSGKVELGQGINTAFAQIVAEELDVPFANVRVIQGDTARTPDQGVSSASRSISTGGPQVRQAAAEAKQCLLELAAKRLDTPIAQLRVAEGTVAAGAVQVSYAELIGDKPFGREVGDKAPLKRPADYKIVGKSALRIDIPGKVTGQFSYVQDVRVPGMMHARVIRPPVIGA